MKNSNLPTAHITAKNGDFAKTVLMPGDPMRSKFIAENYLKNAVPVNNVRCAHGYTGFHNGKKVSVMASGMGMPSIAIYAHELFNFYGVENIIRVGSAGAICGKLKLKDIVLAMGACTTSNFAAQYGLPGSFAPIADYALLQQAAAAAKAANVRYTVGNVLTADAFYDDSESALAWRKMGVKAVEMETAALYMTAARSGKSALSILTVSDFIGGGEQCSAEEREKSFTKMIEIALAITAD